MSSAACAYLSIDSANGVVINSNGLFARATVFNNLGIPQVTKWCAGSPPSLARLSMGYLRAMKEGKTLGNLILREGREAVEKRVIDKAHQDPIFAFDLAVRPRQTLEKFLGVRIPDVVAMNIIVETGGTTVSSSRCREETDTDRPRPMAKRTPCEQPFG